MEREQVIFGLISSSCAVGFLGYYICLMQVEVIAKWTKDKFLDDMSMAKA
jgi:hypothetical protein